MIISTKNSTINTKTSSQDLKTNFLRKHSSNNDMILKTEPNKHSDKHDKHEDEKPTSRNTENNIIKDLKANNVNLNNIAKNNLNANNKDSIKDNNYKKNNDHNDDTENYHDFNNEDNNNTETDFIIDYKDTKDIIYIEDDYNNQANDNKNTFTRKSTGNTGNNNSGGNIANVNANNTITNNNTNNNNNNFSKAVKSGGLYIINKSSNNYNTHSNNNNFNQNSTIINNINKVAKSLIKQNSIENKIKISNNPLAKSTNFDFRNKNGVSGGNTSTSNKDNKMLENITNLKNDIIKEKEMSQSITVREPNTANKSPSKLERLTSGLTAGYSKKTIQITKNHFTLPMKKHSTKSTLDFNTPLPTSSDLKSRIIPTNSSHKPEISKKSHKYYVSENNFNYLSTDPGVKPPDSHRILSYKSTKLNPKSNLKK